MVQIMWNETLLLSDNISVWKGKHAESRNGAQNGLYVDKTKERRKEKKWLTEILRPKPFSFAE